MVYSELGLTFHIYCVVLDITAEQNAFNTLKQSAAGELMFIHQSIYNATHQSHILGGNLGDFDSKCMLYYHMCSRCPTSIFYAVLTELFTTKEICYHLKSKNILIWTKLPII